MARVGNNHPLKGAHGSIGNQMVARTKGNNTFLSMRPRFDKAVPASEAQRGVRDKLGEATGWAQWVLANPVYKQVYERELNWRIGSMLRPVFT